MAGVLSPTLKQNQKGGSTCVMFLLCDESLCMKVTHNSLQVVLIGIGIIFILGEREDSQDNLVPIPESAIKKDGSNCFQEATVKSWYISQDQWRI